MYDRKSNIKEREILFGDFVFREKTNVTVRKGVKWHGAEGEYMARPTKREDPLDEPTIKIVILDTEIHRFRDLPARVLDKEHDERACTYSGLLKGMREAYGESFHEDEYVTVVYFMKWKEM